MSRRVEPSLTVRRACEAAAVDAADAAIKLKSTAYRVQDSKQISAKRAQAARNWKPRKGRECAWTRKCKVSVPKATSQSWPKSVKVLDDPSLGPINDIVALLNDDLKAGRSQSQFVAAHDVLLYFPGFKQEAEELVAGLPSLKRPSEEGDEDDRAKKAAKLDLGLVLQACKEQQALLELMRRTQAKPLVDFCETGKNEAWVLMDVSLPPDKSSAMGIGKPTMGIITSRDGVPTHTQPFHEEAAFVLARILGINLVPTTVCTRFTAKGEDCFGSVQAWCHTSMGPIEDWPVPYKIERLEDARALVSQEDAEFLASLDMMLWSMDRGPQNLLVLKGPAAADQRLPELSSTLALTAKRKVAAIDNGLNLPPYTSLGGADCEAYFDAWITWAHFKTMPVHAPELVSKAYQNLDLICGCLEKVGLAAASIMTLRVTTLYLQIGVVENRCHTLESLAQKMVRDDEPVSWLEQRVAAALASSETADDTFLLTLRDILSKDLVGESDVMQPRHG